MQIYYAIPGSVPLFPPIQGFSRHIVTMLRYSSSSLSAPPWHKLRLLKIKINTMKTLIKKLDSAKQERTQKITLRLDKDQILRLAAIIRDCNETQGPEKSALILDITSTNAGDVISRVRNDYF